MSRRVVLRPAARAEFDEAFDWYEARREGLGSEFAASIEQAVERVLRNPLLHGIVYGEIRCALVRRFPYGVYYLVEERTNRGAGYLPQPSRSESLASARRRVVIS